MSPTPEVQPLPYAQRRFVFIASLVVFFVTVPLLVFYAVGYRFDFSGDIKNIKSVGGMYVTSDIRDIKMFINDQPVDDMRIFQSAAYIQNLEAGMHQIHTQGEGVQTWVKELPVFPHFVTEVQSFNMPVTPQTRTITEYKDLEGRSVYFGATSTMPSYFGSSTNQFLATTSSATSSYLINPEYTYVASLFASSSVEKTLLESLRHEEIKNRFNFGGISTSTDIMTSTGKEYRNTRLYEENGDVYMQWTGKENDIPYYYCVRTGGTTSTALLYGEQVSVSLRAQIISSPSEITAVTDTEQAVKSKCRDRIKINVGDFEVLHFDYFPNSRDLVLIHIESGLYVVEVDDRAWQNSQPLYAGESLETIFDGGQIFIKDGDYYLEVFTELQQ